MPPKYEISERLRERTPQERKRAQGIIAESEFNRIMSQPTLLDTAIEKLFGIPASSTEESRMVDIGQLTTPIAGVSQPVRKVARTWLSRYRPKLDNPISEMMQTLANFGQYTPLASKRASESTGRQLVRGQAYINPETESLLRISGKTPEKAKEIAQSIPVHEIAHGLVKTHLPFLYGDTGPKGVAKVAINELLASALQSLRTGSFEGIMGSFNRAVGRIGEMVDPDVSNRLLQLAITNPRQALVQLSKYAGLSPKQTEAVLSAPWIQQYEELAGKAVERVAKRKKTP